MKYDHIERQNDKASRFEQEIELYMECDSYELFQLKRAAKGLRTTSLGIDVFAYYHFARCHWILSKVIHALVVLFGIFGGGQLAILFKCGYAGFLVLIPCVIFEFLFVCTLGSKCRRIRWFEDGCPIDY